MKAKRKKRIKRDWVAVFEEFAQSGMTVGDFCRSQGMSPSLFYRRRHDIAAHALEGKQSMSPDDFVRLPSPVSSRASISLIFPGVAELLIHDDCDRKLLGDIIAQLKSPSC